MYNSLLNSNLGNVILNNIGFYFLHTFDLQNKQN